MNERIKKVLDKARKDSMGFVSVTGSFDRFSDGDTVTKWGLYQSGKSKYYSSFSALEMDVLELGNDDEFMAMLEDDK